MLIVSAVGHLVLLERIGERGDTADRLPDDAPVVAARLVRPPPPPPPPLPQAAAPVAPPATSKPQRAVAKPRPAPLAPQTRAPGVDAASAVIDPGLPVIDGVAPDAAPAEPSPSLAEQATDAEPAESRAADQAAQSAASSVASSNAERAPATVAAVDPDAPLLASGATFVEEVARAAGAVKLPTTARYVYDTKYSELSLSGTTTIEWQRDTTAAYKLRMVTRALGFDLIELSSSGRLESFGLAPERYVETRTRRAPQAANFDWSGARVSFSGRNHQRALAAGMQDRLSFQFQLMWLAQALPQRVGQDAQMVLPVAGRDDVANYRFRFAGRQKIDTGLGEIDTIRIERIVDQSSDAHVVVWLAPGLDWLPVKLRFTDRHQRVTESVLQSLESAP